MKKIDRIYANLRHKRYVLVDEMRRKHIKKRKELLAIFQSYAFNSRMFNTLGKYKRSKIKTDIMRDVMLTEFAEWMHNIFERREIRRYRRRVVFLTDDFEQIAQNWHWLILRDVPFNCIDSWNLKRSLIYFSHLWKQYGRPAIQIGDFLVYLDGISFIPDIVSEQDVYFGKEFFRTCYKASHSLSADIRYIKLYNTLLANRYMFKHHLVYRLDRYLARLYNYNVRMLEHLNEADISRFIMDNLNTEYLESLCAKSDLLTAYRDQAREFVKDLEDARGEYEYSNALVRRENAFRERGDYSIHKLMFTRFKDELLNLVATQKATLFLTQKFNNEYFLLKIFNMNRRKLYEHLRKLNRRRIAARLRFEAMLERRKQKDLALRAKYAKKTNIRNKINDLIHRLKIWL